MLDIENEYALSGWLVSRGLICSWDAVFLFEYEYRRFAAFFEMRQQRQGGYG
jgi:hypothetical protein